MSYQKFSLIFGFSAWLLATLIFRFWGHAFFLIESDLFLALFFMGTIPVFYFLLQWAFDRYQSTGIARLEMAVLVAIPGMIGDVACLKFHHAVFPKMTIEQSLVLSAWVLWAFVLVLLIGLIKSRT